MKKVILISLLSVVALPFLKAQQLPQYSQYILNRYVINPASAGIDNHFVGQSNYRSQWDGVQDAPRTYILGVNGPIQQGKMGIGGYMFTDITGPTKRNGINFSYSYHVKITDKLKLSMAVNAGILEYSVDGSEITFENPDDVASSALERNILPDAGFSFYLYHEKFFFGASAPQLIQNQIDFEQSIKNTTGRLANHYFVMGGYTHDINSTIKIEPSFLVKYVQPVDPQYEFTLRGLYNDVFWLGATYRHEAAIGLLAGVTLQKNLSFGYSYDIIQSDISNFSTGSHEVMLAIKFNKQTFSTKTVEE